MKSREKESNSNNKKNRLLEEKGERLKECRIAKNLTQEELAERIAEKCDFYSGSRYISNIECGRRNITNEKALIIGEILDVNPAYLMKLSDSKERDFNYYDNVSEDFMIGFHTYDRKTIEYKQSHFFLIYLMSLGYNFSFKAYRRFPNSIDEKDILLSFDEIKETFNVYDYRCIAKQNKEEFEVIIHSVIIDDCEMEFSFFSFYIDQMQRNIIDKMDDFKQSYYELCYYQCRQDELMNRAVEVKQPIYEKMINKT